MDRTVKRLVNFQSRAKSKETLKVKRKNRVLYMFCNNKRTKQRELPTVNNFSVR